MDFKIGDVVRLKSGSPKMSVKNAGPNFVVTEWYNEQSGSFKNHEFTPEQLQKDED
jgi:uncharacterized protein YodC (DUF2158 family)